MINLKTLKKLAKQGLSAVGLTGFSEEIFPAEKETKSAPVPLAPLIQRLGLPELPPHVTDKRRKAGFVFMEIRERFPEQISQRVLDKILAYYGVDLHGYGFFRRNPENRSLLLIVP